MPVTRYVRYRADGGATPPYIAPMKRSTVTNRLLDGLPAKDRERLLAGCEPVELAFGEILAEPGEVLRDIYFPTGSFISLVLNVNGESSLEVALVGNEGMLGAPLALGVDTKQVHAVVQGPGSAWRMSAPRFLRELVASRALRLAIQKYLFVRVSQLEQTAGCNRFHVVEQRLARYLLMTADRSHSDQFHITHEFLAYMLGVRRVGVTRAATALAHAQAHPLRARRHHDPGQEAPPGRLVRVLPGRPRDLRPHLRFAPERAS